MSTRKAGILRWFAFILCFFYLLSCLTPYISPLDFWPMTFLALAFPFLAVLLFLIVLFCSFKNIITAVILLLVFIAGFKNLHSTFSYHIATDNPQKGRSTLRILSWNIRNFDNCLRSIESPLSARRQIINFIRETNADILLLQEFMEYTSPDYYSNIQTLDSLGYHHVYRTNDFVTLLNNTKLEYGSAIFSKRPIIASGKIMYVNLPVPESIAFADVVTATGNLRLFTTHLVSMSLINSSGREDIFFPKYDSAFSFKNPLFRKLIHYDSLHTVQAALLNKVVGQSPHPAIVTGDFNSTPASFVYYLAKGDKRDAFLEKGWGTGATYNGVSPTLRIDFIFTDRSHKVTSFAMPQLTLSDHLPLIADIE